VGPLAARRLQWARGKSRGWGSARAACRDGRGAARALFPEPFLSSSGGCCSDSRRSGRRRSGSRPSGSCRSSREEHPFRLPKGEEPTSP